MAVSASYDYTRTQIQLIRSAMRDIGELAKGQTPDADDYEICSEALNLLIKSWQNRGIGIWLNQECTLYLQNDTIQYALGPSGDNWTADPHKTELASAAAAAATTIVVDSYTGMADADYIGVEQDSGTMAWSTIDTPASTTITIDDALASAAGEDNHVYFYTDKAQRPLEILKDTVRRVDENGHETPLAWISRSQYMAINDKTNEGPVNSVYYDRQLTNGQLYVWPEPDSVKEFLRMTIRRPISDVDALTDHIEVPPEFLRALEWNLAVEIFPKYKDDSDRISPVTIALALESLEDARGLSRESASVFIR